MKAVRRRAWGLFLGAGVVLVALYLAWPDAPVNLIYNAVSVSCAAAIVGGLLLHRPSTALGWIMLAVGAVSYTVGDLVYSTYTGEPFPSWADVFYLGGYPALAAGLTSFARRRGAGRESALDSIVVATGLGAMVWLTVVRPLAEQGGSGWAVKAVALAYPLGSVVLLTAAVALLFTGGLRTAPIRLVVGGAAAQLVGDAVYAHQAVDGTYVGGSWVDVMWLTAYLCFGAAALHPAMDSVTRGTARLPAPLTNNRFLLLMGAALAAPMAYVLFEVSPPQLAGGTAALVVVLVGIRLAGPVQQLARSASHDALTGLPNRALVAALLARELAAASPARGVGLLFCDVDGFKLVNDGLGHAEGDRLLIALSERIRSAVREGDTVARFAGDEFVVIAPGIADARELDRLATRIAARIREPITFTNGTVLHPSMSIGTALATDPRVSAETLMTDADAAMYRSKHGARGDAVLDDRSDALDRLMVTSDLRRALETDELFCVYQPEIDLRTGALFGVEALVRWNHPVRGILSPDEFVPFAEAHGLADDLFACVLRMALRQQAAWFAELGWYPATSVNVSARQHFGRVVDTLAAALDEFMPPRDTVWIELTESALHDDDLSPLVARVHELGALVAIDDFGTGWSSLSRLVACPWDLLKIDRGFVSGGNPQSDHVVSAILAMARSLGIRTAAEGVETVEQALALTDLGCDIGQGYFYARPVPGHALAALVDRAGQWRGPAVPPGSSMAPGVLTPGFFDEAGVSPRT